MKQAAKTAFFIVAAMKTSNLIPEELCRKVWPVEFQVIGYIYDTYFIFSSAFEIIYDLHIRRNETHYLMLNTHPYLSPI
jgi:hypothetical protein